MSAKPQGAWTRDYDALAAYSDSLEEAYHQQKERAEAFRGALIAIRNVAD